MDDKQRFYHDLFYNMKKDELEKEMKFLEEYAERPVKEKISKEEVTNSPKEKAGNIEEMEM